MSAAVVVHDVLASGNGCRHPRYAASECERVAAALPDYHALRVALWEAALAVHYAEGHTSVFPGERVVTCTEGRCPEWFALSNPG